MTLVISPGSESMRGSPAWRGSSARTGAVSRATAKGAVKTADFATDRLGRPGDVAVRRPTLAAASLIAFSRCARSACACPTGDATGARARVSIDKLSAPHPRHLITD